MEYVSAGEASIPALGLGTWQNVGPECAQTVETALELGYRHIDTAQVYDNERQVGKGIDRAGVDRDEIFLTTKVWRSNLESSDLKRSVRESLDRLGVEYVDLLLAHWPHPRISAEESLTAMAELRADGVVRHLGVSNYTRSQLDSAVKAVGVPLVTDQVLYNPYTDQSTLRSYCRDNDIALTAYSPLARGAVLEDSLLQSIGARYDKTAAQVTLRWLVQQEGVVAIPKASSRAHLEANLSVFDFELTDDEIAEIENRSPGLRRRLNHLAVGLMRRNPF